MTGNGDFRPFFSWASIKSVNKGMEENKKQYKSSSKATRAEELPRTARPSEEGIVINNNSINTGYPSSVRIGKGNRAGGKAKGRVTGNFVG